ncbi:hypothetical protein ACT29H_02230 [Thermophagus sp. OGC60D27]
MGRIYQSVEYCISDCFFANNVILRYSSDIDPMAITVQNVPQ